MVGLHLAQLVRPEFVVCSNTAEGGWPKASSALKAQAGMLTSVTCPPFSMTAQAECCLGSGSYELEGPDSTRADCLKQQKSGLRPSLSVRPAGGHSGCGVQRAPVKLGAALQVPQRFRDVWPLPAALTL